MMANLRWDEADEMAMMEAGGVHRGSEEWEQYLAIYRRTARWHWIDAGLAVDDLRALNESRLRRVFHQTMGYELPEND